MQRSRFRTVWRLVSGLLTSANAMLSTLAPEMLPCELYYKGLGFRNHNSVLVVQYECTVFEELQSKNGLQRLSCIFFVKPAL